MRVFKMLSAATAMSLLMPPMTQAQSLPQRDFSPLRFKRVTQPDVDRYVPMATDHDALIILFVKVGSDGIVREAAPIDGFYDPEQAAGARRLGMKLVFEPLTVDGKPREATGAIPLFSKRPGSVLAMSPVLQAALQATAAMISQQDWTGALANLDSIMLHEARAIRDYCAVEALRAAVYEGRGDLPEALHHINEATRIRGGKIGTSSAEYWLTDTALLVQALEVRARIQKALGMLGDALDTFAELQSRQKKAQSLATEPEIDALRKLIAGNEQISIRMRLDAYGKAKAKLVRPVFSLSELPTDGVTEAWVQCGPWNTWPIGLTYFEVPLTMHTWNRPGSADDCRVEFTGVPGTTLTLLQTRP